MVARNLHRWGAHAMALVVALHATFLLLSRLSTGGVIRGDRRVRVAAVSLGAVLALVLTAGQFVPWDSLSIWAVTVGTEQARVHPEGPLGDLQGVDARYDAGALLTTGRLVPAATLRRVWILHGVVLPTLAVVLLVIHFRWGRSSASSGGPSAD